MKKTMAYKTILLSVIFMLSLLANINTYAQYSQNNKPTEATQKLTCTTF